MNKKLVVAVSVFSCLLSVNAVCVSVNPKANKSNGQTKTVRSKKAEELRIKNLSQELLEEVSKESIFFKKNKRTYCCRG